MSAIIRIFVSVWLKLRYKPFTVGDIALAGTMFGFIADRVKTSLTKCNCTPVDEVLNGKFSNCRNIVDKS